MTEINILPWASRAISLIRLLCSTLPCRHYSFAKALPDSVTDIRRIPFFVQTLEVRSKRRHHQAAKSLMLPSPLFFFDSAGLFVLPLGCPAWGVVPALAAAVPGSAAPIPRTPSPAALGKVSSVHGSPPVVDKVSSCPGPC
jgi:hypothetical protein